MIDAPRPGKQASAMERIGLTQEIADFIASAPRAVLPPEAVAAAKRAFIDTLGVIMAGRNEPVVAIVAAQLPDGDQALAWPGNRRLSAGDAALLNGTAGHVLDYDDVAQAGHPSVVMVPAILAGAQRLGVSGRQAFAAYAIGYEVWCELARREPDAFHFGSWHPTAVIGTVAATAALAALNGLPAEQARHALAIAASMASGVIANFGTHMKPLQAGRAAAHAVEAVELAGAGITGAADALEGAHGLLAGISPERRADRQSPARFPPAIGWRLLEQGLSVKRYPVCYASHRAIDAVIAMAGELRPGDVRSVSVTLGRAPAETLRYPHPRDGLEARFSLNHNVAAALVDGAVGFAQLSDGFVRRPDVAELYGLTTMVVDESEPCDEQPGLAKFDRVVIATRDGRLLDSGPIRYPRGHARQPLNDVELAAKFLDCARHGGAERPAAMLALLEGLDAMADLGELR
jgi:2-methylcitrate dehydratase PrpD